MPARSSELGSSVARVGLRLGGLVMRVILRSASPRHLALFSLVFTYSVSLNLVITPQLLSQIKGLVSTSVSDLKRSSDSNAAEQMSEIKRLKRDALPSFREKSDEDQYEASKAVLKGVEDASAAVRRKDLVKEEA